MSNDLQEFRIRVVVGLAMLVWAYPVSAAPEPDSQPAGEAISIIKVASGRSYSLHVARVGEKPYVDRQYQIRKLPASLDKQILVCTSMDDDYSSAADHLQLELLQAMTLSVCLDKRGRQAPGWIEGWALLGESLEVDGVFYHVYQKSFPTGRVALGGNDRNRTGANSNYLVIAGPRVEAPVSKPDPLTLKPVDFVREIQPILQDRCFACHGSKKQEGGLRLDIRRRALLGGDTGPAIVPSSSITSELVRRITIDDEAQRMPPDDEPLPTEQVELLRRWVDQKAPWPDAVAGKESFDDHWSFRAINRPDVPQVVDSQSIRNPIDAFVLARLEREKISPAPEADRRTLARRLSLDLLGLPPPPTEVEAFMNDSNPDAYEQFVDRLLGSTHFGERWGETLAGSGDVCGKRWL